MTWNNPTRGMTGRKHSVETKAKMVASARRRYRDPEERKRMSLACVGRIFSDIHRRRISIAKMGQQTRLGCRLSSEAKEKISAVHKGKIVSLATREKLALAGRRTKIFRPTSLEKALYILLKLAGLCFEREKPIGGYRVDAFVPSHNLVFEADGSYWHQDPKRERERDAHLLEQGVAAVIHLSEEDLIYA